MALEQKKATGEDSSPSSKALNFIFWFSAFFGFLAFLMILTNGFTFQWGGSEGWSSASPVAGLIFGLMLGPVVFVAVFFASTVVWVIVRSFVLIYRKLFSEE